MAVGPKSWYRVAAQVRSGLWFVPVMCVIAGVVLSYVTLWIDGLSGYDLVPRSFTGGPDAALTILGAVATSMVSLAALVLTITMVVVSIAVLVLYVHHIGRSLRVSALIELVGEDTRRLLDAQYPGPDEPRPVDRSLVAATSSGVLCHVEFDRLIQEARDADCTLHLIPAFGEFVASGAPLLRVEGELTSDQLDDARDSIVLGLERTLDQDVAYGLRLLVDIAERSLSDSPFLDPTTAVQAIDRLHDCLRHIARRQFHDGRFSDSDGVVRVTLRVMNWDAYDTGGVHVTAVVEPAPGDVAKAVV